MSDILVPGMEMPKICGECPFVMEDDDFAPSQCGRTNYTVRDGIIDPFGKPEWCDLVEILPHGRLIDADEFYKSLRKCLIRFYSAYEKDKKDERIAALCELDLAVRAVLADAPTIIPVSEEVDNDKA